MRKKTAVTGQIDLSSMLSMVVLMQSYRVVKHDNARTLKGEIETPRTS